MHHVTSWVAVSGTSSTLTFALSLFKGLLKFWQEVIPKLTVAVFEPSSQNAIVRTYLHCQLPVTLIFVGVYIPVSRRLPGFCKIGPVLHHVLAEFLLIHGIRSFRFQRESKQELDLVAMERPRPGGPVRDGRAVVELVKIDGTSGGLGVVLCKLYDWALKCKIPDCYSLISSRIIR